MPSRPNILHIMTDQQSAFALSCTGNPHLSTPHMDKLATRGVRFELAYAGQPICTANRSCMLLGMLPSRIGDIGETWVPRHKPWPQEEIERYSIGHLMNRAGYHSAYAGKWHVHYCSHTEQAIGNPEDHGFEWLGPPGVDYYDGQAEVVTPGCRAFLDRNHKKPFFLTASYIQPHGICFWGGLSGGKPHDWQNGTDPWDPDKRGDKYPYPDPLAEVSPEEFFASVAPPLPPNAVIPENEPEYLATYRKGWGQIPSIGRGSRSRDWSPEQMWRAYLWTYYRLVEQLDGQIGELLDAVEESGHLDDTVILFSSDHGDGAARHLLRNKNVPYDACNRIPLIGAGPGIPHGRVDTTHLVSFGIDLMGTLADYADTTTPDDCYGMSIRPLLEGAAPAAWRDHLIGEVPKGRMVRSTRWKYCCFAESPAIPEQLFDMEKDPDELHNRAADPACAAVMEQHRTLLQAHCAKIGDSFPLPVTGNEVNSSG